MLCSRSHFEYILTTILLLALPTLCSAKTSVEPCPVVFQQYQARVQELKVQTQPRALYPTRASLRKIKLRIRMQRRIYRRLRLIRGLYIGCFESRTGRKFLNKVWKKSQRSQSNRQEAPELIKLRLIDDYFQSHRYIKAGWLTFGLAYGVPFTAVMMVTAALHIRVTANVDSAIILYHRHYRNSTAFIEPELRERIELYHT